MRIKRGLQYLWKNFEEIIISVLFLLMMCVVTLQVVNREFIHLTIVWTEELARFMYVWVAYIGFAYVTKSHKALRIELFVDALSPFKKKIHNIIEDFFTLAFSVYAYKIFVDYLAFSQKTMAPALRVPINYIYIIFPAAMALMTIRALLCTVNDIKDAVAMKRKDKEGVA